MKFQQFTNENQGLAFYEQPKDITTGLSGLDFGGLFSDLDFKGVSTTLQVYLMSNLPALKIAVITASPSYVPDMLRAYMSKVMQDRRAYEPKDLNDYWLPYFTQKGFDPEITNKFFKRFYELFNAGAMPRTIWFPDPEGKTNTGEIPNGGGGNGGISTGAKIGIGVAIIAGIGGLYLAFK